LQEIFSSSQKQVNIVSALIIANTIVERFISRFTHIFTEIVDKVLKKFYLSMKSKFLRDRMALSSMNIFKILLSLKSNSIEIFKQCQARVFMNAGNLKRVELKDFQPYEEIISIFVNNLKILHENNTVVVNEQKLDKNLAQNYIEYLNSVQTYEYVNDYSRFKLIQDYFKALYNKLSQEINILCQEDKWVPAEIDYSVSEILGYILNGKYLKDGNDNILNESTAAPLPGEIKACGEESAIPILIFKNEIHIDNVKYQISNYFSRILSAIKDILFLGAQYAEEDMAIAVSMVKRVLDVVVVG
jgi:hypothetical protein